MSTSVDEPRGDCGAHLDFTAHSQVRFLERYVDPESVRQARRRSASDRDILSELGERYAGDLENFRQFVGDALATWTARAGSIPFKQFRICAGKCRVLVIGHTCVTTLPPRDGRPIQRLHMHKGDDDG